MNGFVKSFVFPFLIALVIFSVIAVVAVPPIINLVFASDDTVESNDDEAENTDGDMNKLNPRANGSLSLMLICTEDLPDKNDSDDHKDDTTDKDSSIQKEFDELINKTNIKPTKSIKFITVTVFDSILNRVSVTYIAPETEVSVKGARTDLDTVLFCAENDLYDVTYDYFPDYALSVTGFKPDIYAFEDINEYIKIADTFKDLTVTMNESINIRSSNGRMIPYRAGTLTVSPSDLYNLITCETYTDNLTKSTILESFSLSVLDKITTLNYYSKVEAAFNRCISSMYRTNATYGKFSEKTDLFFSYKLYSHVAVNLIGETTTSSGKKIFIPNRSASLELFKK